jgi:hypothetical protein
MRDLILQGGPWSSEETEKILDYCESDVMSLKRLLRAMEYKLDMPRALLRGRYMKAASQMEYTGIPIDTKMLSILKNNWDQIRHRLIQDTDTQYGIFENLTFKEERFANWLNTNKIPWPKLNSGKLDLKDETFKEMSLRHTKIQPLRDLRFALSQLRLSDLAIGQDGRNRCILSAFRARTSRNQPSNSRFIFGPAVWLRNLIKPDSGNGLAYIDWSQQEFGIAAVLSQDPNMIEAYESGDPYMAFGIQAGAVPPDAIKETHGRERDQFKACVLAVQYGMGEKSLAKKINQPISQARKLLMLHRQTYHKFWRWSDSVVDYAMLYGKLWTTFGWTIHINSNPNPRFLRNFPMQANGAEMLRIACCKAVEQGIRICAPIHDALLIEAPLNELEYAVKAAQRAMSEASSAVLSGYELRTNVEIIRYPQRYSDERGTLMWERLQKIVSELKNPKFLTLCPHLKI